MPILTTSIDHKISFQLRPYIIVNKNEVTGFIGDTWTILEETLKFKSVFFTF